MEKPILFNTKMVQAILEGRKTQTRRIIKQKYENADIEWFTNKYGTRLVYAQNDVSEPIKNPDGTTSHELRACEEIKKPYEVGDIIYVRETWARIEDFENYVDVEIEDSLEFLYKCDDYGKEHTFIDVGVKLWHPSIHMPKKAARIFLRVTDIRAERLQDITEEDAKAEGICPIVDISLNVLKNGHRLRFSDIWNDIYLKQGYGWDSNPWVWIIEFKRVGSRTLGAGI